MAGRLNYEKWTFRLIELVQHRDSLVKFVSLAAVLCCVFVFPKFAFAQRNLPAKDAAEPEDHLQRLPSNRKISQQLQDLSRQARSGDVSKIRDLLQILQAADPSLMVPDGRETFRPLHRDLIERIQAFPSELQAEILKDASATTPLLRTAYENEGPGAVVRFLHRHSGSAESLKAHLLLAAIHRDRGHRQATLYWLAPVLHSSAPGDLRQIAVAMQDELNAGITPQTDAEVDTDAKAEESSDQEQSEDSITDQPNVQLPAPKLVEQKPADVESTGEDFPLSQSWRQALQLSSIQRRATTDLVRSLTTEAEPPAIAWMAGEPVVDENAIYVRSSGGLLAYDRLTGRILWTRLFDRPTDERRTNEIRRVFPDGNDRSPLDAENLQHSPPILDLHRDEITTRMTSDATRLFAICDTSESPATSIEFSEPFRRMQRRGDLISSSMRELVAIEKSTGRRLWSVGGAPLEEQFGNQLSQAWFAGPPTVFGGMLFDLVEQKDAHWLACLRCETGEVLWKVMLAYPDTDIFQDSSRQLNASRPLVADGLIWTNTSDGWLIAVDALTHSVIWSRSSIQKQTGMSRGRNLRGGLLQIQPPTPFRDCWRPEAMQLASDTLLVIGPEGHQMLMINPLTGSVRRRISPESATVILSVDDESIVVAGPQKIQRLRRDNFEVVWATKITTAGVAPTGPGTRLDDHLLVALSDSSVQIVRYSDGQLVDNIPGLRPRFSAGGLMKIAGDIISYGPDHIALLNQSGTTVPREPDPIEQARSLIAAGQFSDAEKTLAGLTPTSEQEDAVRQLSFRIAAALTLNAPALREDHLLHAALYAKTSQEKAIVQFLTFESQPEITSDQIVAFLKAAPAVLNTELPDKQVLKSLLVRSDLQDLIGSSESDPDTISHVKRPMRRVLLQRLEEHLVETELSTAASWISALAQISDQDLLLMGLRTTAVRDELLRRADDAVRAGKLTESTLHLLLQARNCENQIRLTNADRTASKTTENEFEKRFVELLGQYRTGLAANAVRVDLPLRPHPAALNLLSVLQAELQPTMENENPFDPQHVLAEQWAAWKDQSYSIVPVNPVAATTSLQRNERRLLPSCREDQFLSAWNWSIFLEPAVLTGRSLLLPTQPMCTIDGGVFDPLSSGGSGTITRFGSVVLVQNATGLTAVSIIDQRVLWSRRIPNQPSGTNWQMMSDMHLFNRFSTRLPAWQEIYGRNLRICGGNARWICVQSPEQVEMIDLLTGQNLWSLQTRQSNLDVFATESCVFLSHLPSGPAQQEPESVVCLNRVDGTNRESAFTSAQLQQTIRATGDELVVWESTRQEKETVSLHWVHSSTGEARHSLPLTNMLNCQFMDARTIVSITNAATFEVIDLLSAERQIVRFSDDVNKEVSADKGTTPDYLHKAVIVADPFNYYVFPIPNRRASPVQMMLNSTGELNLYPVEKELRAIDRASGKTRWIREADEGTTAWFGPTANPVLLLVNFSVRKNNVNAPPAPAIPGLPLRDEHQTTVTGLSRISGRQLFDYKVTSRFLVPSLEFKITPQQHLDLQAFGNRVRFVPEAASTAVP